MAKRQVGSPLGSASLPPRLINPGYATVLESQKQEKGGKVILILFYLQTLVTVFVLQMRAFLNQSRTKRFQITADILWVVKFANTFLVN